MEEKWSWHVYRVLVLKVSTFESTQGDDGPTHIETS